MIGDGPGLAALRREVLGRLIPNSVTLSAAPGDDGTLSPLLADRPAVDGNATAYVCERYTCQAPVTTPDALRAELDAALARTVGTPRPG